MRLLHPKTLEIVAYRDDLPKTIIAHAWSEVFKSLATKQSHPKMFIQNNYDLGMYLGIVFKWGKVKGCQLDKDKIKKLPVALQNGFESMINYLGKPSMETYFDDNYLFSDACSLYYKGHNIFPDIFDDNWRKYVPVESLKEIKRQVDKTLNIK